MTEYVRVSGTTVTLPSGNVIDTRANRSVLLGAVVVAVADARVDEAPELSRCVE